MPETQDLILQEVECTRFLEPITQNVGKKKKVAEITKIETLNQADRKTYLQKNSPITRLLITHWNYKMIIELLTEVTNALDKKIDIRKIPAMNHYHIVVKTFLTWKLEERYSGKCGSELRRYCSTSGRA